MLLRLNLILKRIFDLFSSSILIIILIPVFIAIAVVIKLDSYGPIFFKQERRTKDGTVFLIYKFRTMVVGAENIGTGLFNYENDTRITNVGKFLRKTSLDELPQLFNIVKGDMSVVGPRPCVIYELGEFETLNKKYKKRFEMKAGLTGLAQVKGRNNISWDKKVEFDNQYIDLFKKYGIMIDVKILFLSVISVFHKDNIYEHMEDGITDDILSAKIAEEEIIKLAHVADTDEEPVNGGIQR